YSYYLNLETLFFYTSEYYEEINFLYISGYSHNIPTIVIICRGYKIRILLEVLLLGGNSILFNMKMEK
ncbi:MAG: hypothetical protein ACW99L_07725, partial [Promethearchaeota archaeon]